MNEIQHRPHSAPPCSRYGYEFSDVITSNDESDAVLTDQVSILLRLSKIEGQLVAGDREALRALCQQNDQLQKEVLQLHQKTYQQAKIVKDTENRITELTALRVEAEGRAEEQQQDIAEQACDQATLEADVWRLEQERDQLRCTLLRTSTDLEKFEHKCAGAERELANKDQLAKRPAHMLAQKERKIQQLNKHIEEKALVIKNLREQLAQSQSKAAASARNMNSEKVRQQLRQEVTSSTKTQAFLEERCWQLEEDLEARDCTIRETEAEVARLASQLDQVEQQKHLLEEQVQEANAIAKNVSYKSPLVQQGDSPCCSKPECSVGSMSVGMQEQPAPEPENTSSNSNDQTCGSSVLEVNELHEDRIQHLEATLAVQNEMLERTQSDFKRSEAQLKVATQVLQELECTTSQLQGSLADGSETLAVSKMAQTLHDTRNRLHAVVHRCRDLEEAGTKVLAELDEKDQQLTEEKRKVCLLERHIEELQKKCGSVMLHSEPNSTSFDSDPINSPVWASRACPPSRPQHVDSAYTSPAPQSWWTRDQGYWTQDYSRPAGNRTWRGTSGWKSISSGSGGACWMATDTGVHPHANCGESHDDYYGDRKHNQEHDDGHDHSHC